MVNELIGATLQILVFTLIPFLVYTIKNKSTTGFFEYIGLKRSTKKANYLAVFACLIFATPVLLLTLTSVDFKEIMFDPASITGKFRQMGFGMYSVSTLLIVALFKTSFAEEILFRGFVAKRLISVMGYQKGNMLQATLFGIIHTALFASITSNAFFLLVIFIVPSIGAYVSVYLNEKLASGSIVPGWISHGLANVLAYSIVGFII
ncbi:MAG: CPBP family intramembrane glutamic endopeptidase [Reichenbachiella sp.]|uniref:CPBP family intramembrane glutamic endopeptidase n=1 Tax=Reichenbachiella sp. TaxID=2184521 RepID=UPI003266B6BC